ncbi:MAG: tRNA (N6-threonylcarbamoyladenosine(37)-N6)-methyltransferase TrmO [Methanolinea sp.]|jgi:tRNA-Thr(GGU) m(6)t(6)A37 methyltransferase TsaA|nr:tRNA (N6-threonylcarbamoyladenosine(37)-N6)-methyltransferase TrmO [Methanolinea sp.]
MISLEPVGVIRSPYTESGQAPRQGRDSPVVSTLELYPEYIPCMGTMEGISHIWVLYWMDRADRHLLTARRSDWNEARPVFSIRSPARPNPIALSIGEIQAVGEGTISVTGIEALDGSPILDIKPYIRDIDCIPHSTK